MYEVRLCPCAMEKPDEWIYTYVCEDSQHLVFNAKTKKINKTKKEQK